MQMLIYLNRSCTGYMKDSLAIESLKKGLNIDDSKYQRMVWLELCWGEGRYEEGKLAMESFKQLRHMISLCGLTLKYYLRVKKSLDFSFQQMSGSKFNALG